MSPIKQQLNEIIDYLPDQEVLLLFEIAKRFFQDDSATVDDLAAINTARNEYARNETVNHNSINWD